MWSAYIIYHIDVYEFKEVFIHVHRKEILKIEILKPNLVSYCIGVTGGLSGNINHRTRNTG